MSNKRRFQDLTIRDNFIFSAVMMQDDNCKQFLEMLLGIEIREMVISYEKSLIYNPEYKGVRLDIYVNDENNTRYDVEMQVVKQQLGRRARYYHSQMDMDILQSGHEYSELPTAYVIFVCDFDPFGEGKYCYSFENRCLQDFSLNMGDDSRSIFLSTEGKDVASIPKGLKAFLDFVKNDTAENNTETDDAYVKKLQDTIRRVKENKELERSFMTLEEIRKAGKEEGRMEGRNEVKESILTVLKKLGTVSDELKTSIMSKEQMSDLTSMLIQASRATSIEEFEGQISNL